MTHAKTAEEVAGDTYWGLADFPIQPKGSDLRALMVRAIEADRAQYADLLYGARASVAYNVGNRRTLTSESLTGVIELLDALEGARS